MSLLRQLNYDPSNTSFAGIKVYDKMFRKISTFENGSFARKVKGYTKFVENHVTGRSVSD